MRSPLLLILALPVAVAAQVPMKIGYQGRLTHPDGAPVTGVVALSFGLFPAADGGTARWTETQNMALTDGYYATYLGEVKPLPASAFAGSELFLELTVDGTTLAPRQRIGSVPYAVTCGSLAGRPSDGSSPETALASCRALYAASVRRSGTYFIKPDSTAPAILVWCDMETNGGGWTMVYNSVESVNTLDFWYIPYADRLGRRGSPSPSTNFYDGSLYKVGTTYMDVIEDLRGKAVVALVATTTSMNTFTMTFVSPVKVSGDDNIYSKQFAAGWSAPDYDGDPYSASCSVDYNNVSQHYGACWAYNLGSDADNGDNTDGRLGPHLHSGTAQALGLFSDGSSYTRVHRITRLAEW